ncbi:hypothetical protein JIN85_14615 [Luteolibacter pohnpeiensis]|uniref:Lysozyme n=1 Tax=Luteolibacter pohnpeiensis TaxID=454153 RepID=A0A934SA32_9BACT|nr:hypothetical protein [Luteolibacter pohnpeiensis]MBK1883651.1 hypothetical protein [Luteolibacter pohnpeiensis]
MKIIASILVAGTMAMASMHQFDKPIDRSDTIKAGDLTISKESWDLIIEYEVGGGAGYYNRYLKQPTVPPGESGITIGIGYDLRFNSPSQIRKDWGDRLPKETVDRLCSVSGLNHSYSKAALPRVKSISIPWETALEVYRENTVPRFSKLAKSAYPGITKMNPDIQGVMLSTSFNRGTSFIPYSTRKELIWTRDDIAAKKDSKLPDYQLQMRRLWPNIAGLQRRYAAHAGLMQKSLTK